MSDIKEIKDKATGCAKECIDRLKNADWKARGEQVKSKAKEITSKENIEKVKEGIKGGVKNMKTAEGREKLKASVIAGAVTAKNKVIATWNSGPKGKAICVGAVALLLAIGLMTGDDEDFANGKLGDADDIMLSDKGFSTIFMNAGSPKADDGMIYLHSENTSVQVLQSTSDGLLVGYVTGSNPFMSGLEDFFEKFGGSYDRIVFVTTDGARYEDGQPLRSGYYVRSGIVSYVGVDGGEHTVAHYVEITNEKEIAKIERAITKRKEAKESARLEMEETQSKECAKKFTPKWFDNAFKVLLSDRVVVQKSERSRIGTMNCPEFDKIREIAATGDWRKFKDAIHQRVKLMVTGGGDECDIETAAGCFTNIIRGLQDVHVQLRGLVRGYKVSFSNLDLKERASMSLPFNPTRHGDPDLKIDSLLFVFEVDPCGEFPEMVDDENHILISERPYRKTFIARLGVLKKFCKEHSAEITEMRRSGSSKDLEKALELFIDAN